MPRGTCLVNTSRGEVVNEQAVVDALVSGHLGGYATDVLTDEDFYSPFKSSLDYRLTRS